MNAYLLPRLFITMIVSALATVGFAFAPVSAADTAHWSDKINEAEVLVQDCRGPSVVSGFSPTLAFGFDFEIITSYRTDRDFSTFADYTGIDHPVMERRFVSFVGIAANSETGLALAYDGQFTRTATVTQSDVMITDLTLHLVSSDEKSSTITVNRDRPGAIENPEDVLLAYAPRGLDMSLCSYFAGLEIAE